jgi:hypothetical protein
LLFANQQIDFDSCNNEPTQQLELVKTSEKIEMKLKRFLFQNIQSLGIFIKSNFGSDKTILLHLGLKGEYSKLVSQPLGILYEAVPNPSDHKTREYFNNFIKM